MRIGENLTMSVFSDYETTTLPPITTMRPDLGAPGCMYNGVFYQDGDQVSVADPARVLN